MLTLTGCGNMQAAVSGIPAAKPAVVHKNVSEVVQVTKTTYLPKTHSVLISTRSLSQQPSSLHAIAASGREDLLDIASHEGIINFATTRYATHSVKMVEIHQAKNGKTWVTKVPVPTELIQPSIPAHKFSVSTPTVASVSGAYVLVQQVPVRYHAHASLSSAVVGVLQVHQQALLVSRVNHYWYEVQVAGRTVYITTDPQFVHVVYGSTTRATSPTPVPTSPNPVPTSPPASTPQGSTTGLSAIALPPPNVRMDPSIQALAPLNAPMATKVQAVLSVAQSKLGTPYIWGHNEDRGQYGFDCSNFTEYVYHHALGYLMTTSSRGQYLYVGVDIPVSQMLPGDLLVFNQGSHVGIYAGNNQMIEEGGGLGKVGYLPVQSGSYWGDHISAVKRLF